LYTIASRTTGNKSKKGSPENPGSLFVTVLF